MILFYITAVVSACPDTCTSEIISDGYCSYECFDSECQYDAWDCTCDCANIVTTGCLVVCNVNCANGCPTGYIGDGFCDSDCNNRKCEFDGGDCNDWCSEGCLKSWLGDGVCDDECDNDACDSDDGDCSTETNTTIIIVLTVVGFILAVLAFFCICSIVYFILRKRNPRVDQVEELGSSESAHQLTSEVLNQRCPSIDYDSMMFEFEDKVCVICLDEIHKGCKIKKLPCKHVFHDNCVADWLIHNSRNPRCPT
mmetsp:Transcript_21033/g.38935  ORF Transcript_21033/g.38935 Transcript_21033/m.38935 type:complete len:253 (+) Transcript_21033:54-812(+)